MTVESAVEAVPAGEEGDSDVTTGGGEGPAGHHGSRLNLAVFFLFCDPVSWKFPLRMTTRRLVSTKGHGISFHLSHHSPLYVSCDFCRK